MRNVPCSIFLMKQKSCWQLRKRNIFARRGDTAAGQPVIFLDVLRRLAENIAKIPAQGTLSGTLCQPDVWRDPYMLGCFPLRGSSPPPRRRSHLPNRDQKQSGTTHSDPPNPSHLGVLLLGFTYTNFIDSRRNRHDYGKARLNQKNIYVREDTEYQL